MMRLIANANDYSNLEKEKKDEPKKKKKKKKKKAKSFTAWMHYNN